MKLDGSTKKPNFDSEIFALCTQKLNNLMYKTGPHCALAIPRQNLVFLLPLMLWLLQSRLTSFEEKVIWNCCLLLHYSIKTKG